MADTLDNLTFYQGVGEEAERPLCIAFGGVGAGEEQELGFGVSIEFACLAGSWLFCKCFLQSLFAVAAGDVLYGSRRAEEHFCNLLGGFVFL